MTRSQNPTVAALVVAAGRGSRAGPGLPKQYRALGGEPVLRRTVRALAAHPRVEAVLPVIHPDDAMLAQQALAGLSVLDPVSGGESRQASVVAGLEALEHKAPALVLIQDGARPFASTEIVDRVLSALERFEGAIAALPISDSLKRGDTVITESLPREGLWRAQTPQGFRFHAILAAHRAAAGLSLSDDAAVAERAGLKVALVAGSEDNIKVTTEADFARAERILASHYGDVRTGIGFDVHRFGEGNHVWLCGVRVPHGQGLIGHSDADVGLHALTDSLLGALGAGDIGVHFPPSEARWRNAPSDIFLAHAVALARQQDALIAHVDVTLICERPKIAPYREMMVARIAELLGLAPTRVSVKATTTEGLGFTGRGEGIAAQAVATLRFRT